MIPFVGFVQNLKYQEWFPSFSKKLFKPLQHWGRKILLLERCDSNWWFKKESRSVVAGNFDCIYLMYSFKHSAQTMSCTVLRNFSHCLPYAGTVPSTKQRSSVGYPSFQHHLMLLNSGSLYKTCGSIWRLCLLGETLPKTCHRYSKRLFILIF